MPKPPFDAERGPVTVPRLIADLRALGVSGDRPLMVHSSLSALGWVCGGAVAVLRALDAVIGPDGTLAMPAHTNQLSDPAGWSRPPVPQGWWDEIRATMPAFDVELTPPWKMGAVVEAFRHAPGVRRSHHPHFSFLARGPLAERIVAGHALDFGLGEGSPLARLYDLDARVLLLGVGHESNTSLHLAEFRAADLSGAQIVGRAPMSADGTARWVEFRDLDWNADDFPAAGAAFEATSATARVGPVGHGIGRVMSQRELVEFATEWFARNRR